MAKSLSEFADNATPEQKKLLLEVIQQIEEGERFMKIVRELEKLSTDGIRVTESDKRVIRIVLRKLANLVNLDFESEPDGKCKTQKVDWSLLTDKMEKRGATTEAKAMSRSDIEMLYFGNEEIKFENNQWNAEKGSYLQQIGDRRGAEYFVAATKEKG